jgi:hypothetical protein
MGQGEPKYLNSPRRRSSTRAPTSTASTARGRRDQGPAGGRGRRLHGRDRPARRGLHRRGGAARHGADRGPARRDVEAGRRAVPLLRRRQCRAPRRPARRRPGAAAAAAGQEPALRRPAGRRGSRQPDPRPRPSRSAGARDGAAPWADVLWEMETDGKAADTRRRASIRQALFDKATIGTAVSRALPQESRALRKAFGRRPAPRPRAGRRRAFRRLRAAAAPFAPDGGPPGRGRPRRSRGAGLLGP